MNNENKVVELTNEEYEIKLENAIKELNEYNDKLQQDLQRKDNIINELKKWLEVKEEKETIGTFSDVLDKINELEGDNK